ncbi:MAG: uroporphyrinogen-III C-methyltransferase [Clostridiales bacterium]|nr:uroporphyrinogen-III C-methyltransferase [Clostridiales bacterium]
MSRKGKVFLVGAGCGDYDLITLRGMALLEKCEVVVYDSLTDNRLLDFVPPSAEKICVGKRAGNHSEKQENINNLLVRKASEGKTIVRLKGGDPFVFGRGGEEILSLQANGIEYSIVPGISSSIAVPELAGIPATHREISRSVHIITGHTSEDLLPDDMNKYAALSGTLVFLMGLKNLKRISQALISCGKDKNTPSAVISNGASASQKIVKGKLKNIADNAEKAEIKSPATTVIGDAAAFDFLPTIKLPLNNITVTVTGTINLVKKLSVQFENLGAKTENMNHLDVIEYAENQDFDNALLNIGAYGVIALTSINGAEIFFERLLYLNIDIRSLYNVKFAIIGSGTAEALKSHGIIADIIPDVYIAEALSREIVNKVPNNEKILILRAEQGSSLLTENLDKAKKIYDDIKIYDVKSNGKKTDNTEITTDFLTFASSSGVNAFFESGCKISSETKLVCIGNSTAETLKRYGVNNLLIAKTQNVSGIIDTILREVKNEQIQTSEKK